MHEGSQIRIKFIKNKAEDVLISNKFNRSHGFKLNSNEFAKVYHGRKHGKTWAYIFNQKQTKKFTGFKFYPYNQSAFVDATFERLKPTLVRHKTFQGDTATVRKIGIVTFHYSGKKHQLSAYNWQQVGKETGIVLIFTDHSSGKETYGGGRELFIKISDPRVLNAKKKFKTDFNKSINFSCAHNPFWHCPVGLQEKLPTLLNAGELLPSSH